MYAGSFYPPTMTWTIAFLTCVPDHSYSCIYTQGILMSQHNIFDLEKLTHLFLVLLAGFEPLVFGSRVRLYQLSHPANVTLSLFCAPSDFKKSWGGSEKLKLGESGILCHFCSYSLSYACIFFCFLLFCLLWVYLQSSCCRWWTFVLCRWVFFTTKPVSFLLSYLYYSVDSSFCVWWAIDFIILVPLH